MKIRWTLFYFSLVAFLPSCSITPLTEKGRRVQFAKVEQPGCTEVGRVFAQNWWDGDIEDVKNKLRNQAGDLGGNVVVLENSPPWSTRGTRNPAYGPVFSCPDIP